MDNKWQYSFCFQYTRVLISRLLHCCSSLTSVEFLTVDNNDKYLFCIGQNTNDVEREKNKAGLIWLAHVIGGTEWQKK